MVHKTIEESSDHLESSISLIPDRYKEAVDKADWQGPASSDAAEKNYSEGVAKAVANKTRQKGVKRVSNADWQNKSMTMGADRIGAGISANLDKYKQNFSPVLDAMNKAADAAPPRSTDAMQNIDKILKPVVKAAIAASPKNK